MMQNPWRGGPHMRGGGMFGRGGGFNTGGFRGGRGRGGRFRNDRSRSPVRGKPAPLGEPSDWEMRTDVFLDFFNSDLNLSIDESGVAAKPLCTEGFAFMWGGARATYGVRNPAGKNDYPTNIWFEVSIGEKLPVSHLPPEESNPHVLRVGWSTDDTSFALGEEPRSWGYGGTAKKSCNCKFENYGIPFSTGDVVAAFLEFEANGIIRMSYAVNGQHQGEGFRTNIREIGDRALFPHIYSKNLPFEVNFGQRDNPWFPHPEGQTWTFIGEIPVEKRVRGLCPPEKIEDCSMLMMCGLPGAGKTFWAEKHAQNTPEKRYTVLGTNNILDKMKVMGLPRKRNYSGRWDVLIELSTKCLNKLFEIASRRKRNYILDQTNVYPNAQRRKMRPFESFHRKAVLVVPTDDEFQRRIAQRTKEEGKEVPESAVLEMKANFKIPDENDLFEEIMFTELEREDAENLVRQYNEEAQAWKRTTGGSSISGSDFGNQDNSGARFKPDRNYGRSSEVGSSVHDDSTSVGSFGRGRDFSERIDHDRGMRGRNEWRGGRGGFRGGFNNNRDRSNERPDGGFRGFGGTRDERDGGPRSERAEGFKDDRSDRGPAFYTKDSDRGRRFGFEGRRGSFQRNDGDRRRFGDRDEKSDMFGDSREFQAHVGGNRPGFSDHSVGGRDNLGQDRRSFSNERDPNFSDRNRGGFSGDRSRDFFPGQMSGPRGREGPGYGNSNVPNFGGDNEGFADRNVPNQGGMYGRNRGAFGVEKNSGNFRTEQTGGFSGGVAPGGFGAEHGGTSAGDQGRSGFGGFSGRREYGFGDSGNAFGEREMGFSDRDGGRINERPGMSDRRGGMRFGSDRGRMGGERGGRGFGGHRGGSPSNAGFGSDRPGNTESSRFGGFSDQSASDYSSTSYSSDRGRGGHDRGGAFGGNRGSGFGANRGGFGTDRGGFGADRGGFGADRGGFGADRSGYGDRVRGGYANESASSETAMSARNRPKVSRWSDAQPPDSGQVRESESKEGGARPVAPQLSKGYGDYSSRVSSSDSASYSDNLRQSSYSYGGRQHSQSIPPRGDYTSQSGQCDNVAYAETADNVGYDGANRQLGSYDYGSSYPSQGAPQQESAGYNYGQSASGSYGPYSHPPPQLPHSEVLNYQQNYGSSSANYSGWNQQTGEQSTNWTSPQSTQPQQNWQQWQQPPPSTSQQQHTSTPNEQWSYYQQPPPQDWQQQTGYQ